MSEDADYEESGADEGTGLMCAYCQCGLEGDDEATQCPGCQAIYHDDCWEENEGCAVYGCNHVPEVEKLSDVEVPVSYWGQEDKPCPVCAKQIKAAAIRCRHCGAVFETSMPLDEDRYRNQILSKNRLPRMKIYALLIFVLCLIPLTSPFGIAWGVGYLALHWKRLKEFPTFHKMLIVLGIGVSVLYIIGLIFFGLVHIVAK